MKKFLALILVAVFVIGAVSVVSAHPRGRAWQTCEQQGCFGYTNLTAEEKAKAQEFRSEVLPLRQQLLVKRSELQALRAQSDPDWSAIEQKRKEMATIRTEIERKAREAGLSGIRGACDGTGRMGMMRGRRM